MMTARQGMGLRGCAVVAHMGGAGAWIRWRHLFIHPCSSKEITMPIILWLLGVPLSVVLLLMLFGVL